MKQIVLTRLDDDTIEVTSDVNPMGSTSTFREITDSAEQFLVALADHLGLEAAEVLNLDSDYDEDEDW